MKNISNKQKLFECALGHHKYTIPSKNTSGVLMCPCGRKGYYNSSRGYTQWYAYDDKGNLIHYKDSTGFESWKNNNGKWVDKKPENWIYEKYIK